MIMMIAADANSTGDDNKSINESQKCENGEKDISHERDSWFLE
jgi:hypothetical protein